MKRMTPFAFALASMVLVTLNTASADISILYGNSIAMKNAETEFSAYFNKDGSYSSSKGDTGSWTLEGDQLCVLLDGADASRCGPAPLDKAIGDSWSMTDQNGESITATLVSGR